jgi:hypothetical protein
MKIIKKREGEENWKDCGREWGEVNALPLYFKDRLVDWEGLWAVGLFLEKIMILEGVVYIWRVSGNCKTTYLKYERRKKNIYRRR